MCIGIPLQVVREDGIFAWCEGRGEPQRLDMSLVGPQPPGTWVLAFLGTAREVLEAEQARLIGEALDGLEAALHGGATDFDRFFPDLAGREPQLPPHLRPELATE
jgi:hydrogenase expression/formation protein HypC